MRKRGGITLIALIISIIIMLILAGVTINIVINGGLFKQAQTATVQQDIANAGETLQAELLAKQIETRDISGGITEQNIKDVVDKAGVLQGYTVMDNGNGAWVLSGVTQKGNAIHDIIINKNGIGVKTANTKLTGTVSYSMTSPTNQPVTVTITTSEPLNTTPVGWTKVDDTHYTRIYTISTEEDVIIVGSIGNIGTIHIAITNIDTTMPNGMASYDPATATTGNITVTITTNKAINTPNGWTKVDDTTYTKVYAANTTENVTITDSASNTGAVNVAVTNIVTAAEKRVIDAGYATTIVADMVDGVPIPKGFTASTVSGENTKDGGLVITDNVNGNQFVWVPVPLPGEDISYFYDSTNKAGQLWTFQTGRLSTKMAYTTTGHREPDIVSSADGTSADPIKLTKTIMQTNFDAMIASVAKYKGFYIARYETTGTITAPTIKKGQTVIINQSWYSLYTAENNMYAGSSSVVSTVIWGCQWDATLRWINTNPANGNYVTDSTGKGIYSATTPAVSGASESYKVNNIYDMAGNVWNWTQEAQGTYWRSVRGGAFNNTGAAQPASNRAENYDVPTVVGGYYGSRVQLYLK